MGALVLSRHRIAMEASYATILCLRIDGILGSSDIIDSVVKFCGIVPANAIVLGWFCLVKL